MTPMTSHLARILALDDDSKFLEHLGFALRESFELITATSVDTALEQLRQERIDAVILDYHLGLGQNGHLLLDRMREMNYQHPVIVVSGVVDLQMTVGFLKRRVFGFLEKPVSLQELQNLLSEAVVAGAGNFSAVPPEFEVDQITRQVKLNENVIGLTPTEFEILSFFTKNKRKQVLRDELIQHLWGETRVSKHAFDTHLLNLKKKLPPFATRLVSIYGVGYCYEA